MKFNKLKFEDISSTHGPCAIQATVTFSNGYEVSVVKHNGSYGSDKGLYEIGVFDALGRMRDPLGWGDTVKGYLTPEGVEKELELISNL